MNISLKPTRDIRGGEIDALVSASDIRCQLGRGWRPGDGLLYPRPGNGGEAHQGGVTDTLLLFVLAAVSLAIAGLILAAFVSLHDTRAPEALQETRELGLAGFEG